MNTDPAAETDGRPPFPRLVRTAAVLWLIGGGLMLVFAQSILMTLIGRPVATWQYMVMLIIAIVALGFIWCGVQIMLGRAKDTLIVALASLIVGGVGSILSFGLASAVLLIAGILALVDRRAYLRWRTHNTPIRKVRSAAVGEERGPMW